MLYNVLFTAIRYMIIISLHVPVSDSMTLQFPPVVTHDQYIQGMSLTGSLGKTV
jgi:hypothetical protein